MPGTLRLHRPAADVLATTMAAIAVGKGQFLAHNYARARYTGWCKAAVILEHAGYGHTRIGNCGRAIREPARTLSLAVRCRKCDGCRKERRMMWTERAAREWRQSTRTWFVTLTMRPEEHYKLQCQVAADVAEEGGELDAMPRQERLARVLGAYKAIMDRYLMRLRTGLRTRGWHQVQFRYLWVPEPHKSGAIHFHMLLHEVSEDMPLVKARIEAAWGYGFISSKLVKTEEAARYVTKYLGKHHYEGRLNVSTKYGKREEDPNEQLAKPALPMNPQGVPPQVIQTADAEARQQADFLQELGIPPGAPEVEEVQPGEDLEPCASGLHVGVKCDCHLLVKEDEDPYGLEESMLTSHGVPKRRWRLRGWHEPDPALDKWKDRPRRQDEAEQPGTLH